MGLSVSSACEPARLREREVLSDDSRPSAEIPSFRRSALSSVADASRPNSSTSSCAPRHKLPLTAPRPRRMTSPATPPTMTSAGAPEIVRRIVADPPPTSSRIDRGASGDASAATDSSRSSYPRTDRSRSLGSPASLLAVPTRQKGSKAVPGGVFRCDNDNVGRPVQRMVVFALPGSASAQREPRASLKDPFRRSRIDTPGVDGGRAA
jgi:hypothetical protein